MDTDYSKLELVLVKLLKNIGNNNVDKLPLSYLLTENENYVQVTKEQCVDSR